MRNHVMSCCWDAFRCSWADLFYSVVKRLPWSNSGILDAHTVVIDCADGIAQQFGYLGNIINTQANTGINTQFGRQFSVGWRAYLPFIGKQVIELSDKIRVDRQNSVVERVVELLHFLLEKDIRISLACPPCHLAKALNILAINGQEVSYM